MVAPTLFSSATDNWATPQKFFDSLLAEFGAFDLDPCADDKNHKAPNYFTKEVDGLAQDWTPYKRVFVNPPYGRGIEKWIAKAIANVRGGGAIYPFCSSPLEPTRRIFTIYSTKRKTSSFAFCVVASSLATLAIAHLSLLYS